MSRDRSRKGRFLDANVDLNKVSNVTKFVTRDSNTKWKRTLKASIPLDKFKTVSTVT